MMKSIYALSIATTLAFAAPALASIDLVYTGTNPGVLGDYSGSTAEATLTFSDAGAFVYMDVSVTNTTPGSIGANLTAMAFDLPDTNPAFYTNVTFDAMGSILDTFGEGESLQPFGAFDVSSKADSGNLKGAGNGGPGGGLDDGDTTAFRFILETALTAAAVEDLFQDAYTSTGDFTGDAALKSIARFKGVGSNGDSDKVPGLYVPNDDPDNPGGGGGGAIPEPVTASLGLIGLAGLGLSATRRRR